MPTDCSCDCIAYEQLPKSVPMAFVRGDDFSFALRVSRDLATYTLAASITNADTGSTVCTFSVSQAPVTVLGQTHTRITLSLTDLQTALLTTPGSYRWSLRWTSPSGDTRTPLFGKVRAVKR